MNRAVGLLVAASLAIGCSSTGPRQPEPAPAPAEPAVATDPRVSELRVMVLELVDRMEVMQSRMNRMEDVLTELSSGNTSQPSAGPVRRQDDQAAVRRYQTAANAADAYNEAMTMFGRGQNNDARRRFMEVYEADPNGELADNALYWVGETYFVMKDLHEAIRYYDRIISEFPAQNKAPDAMHKKALSLVKLGDLSLAKKTLESLIERYPHSTAAAAARTELERIRY